MESPPASSDHGDETFDSSKPFAGVVLCCTSIPPEHRTEIANKTGQLGGVHKYDLTPDVTHLIVGEYNTPKYRHVAKERPDIKPMAVGWVDAVRNMWVKDEQTDFGALEKEWCLKAFETGGGHMDSEGNMGVKDKLLCCLTGFEDPTERQMIIDKIKANGGDYTGDFSKLVTHLIVYRPHGKKYNAARAWKTHTVALQWVDDSIQRGMILDERYYDPVLPEADLGKGAWNKREIRRSFLGKRQRAATLTKPEEGRRKLRKTASMKLNSQRENMWGEILGQPSAEQSASHQTEEPTQPLPNDSMLRPNDSVSRVAESTERSRTSFGGPENRGDTVFASCGLHVFGFSQQQTEVLLNTVSSLGGTIAASIGDLTSSEGLSHRFVIVPQSADPASHPLLPDGVEAITECFIERCLHRRMLLNPREHVIGRPFPVFPIEGFDKLSICTAGFTDVDLLQVDRAIRQLGARFEERFNAQCSLLVCTSLDGVRKQKLDLALFWRLPVVKADWLWECISQGRKLSIKDFIFPELRARAAPEEAYWAKPLNRSKSTSNLAKKITPKSLSERVERPGRSSIASVDMSAFDRTPLASTDPPAIRGKTSIRRESNAATDFETAPTHQSTETSGSQRSTSRHGSRSEPCPLTEKSASDLNKTSAPDPVPSQTRKPLSRIRSEVCDSEAGDDECLDAVGHDGNTGEGTARAGADAAELEKRRLEREKAEAERLALSSKLTTLLGAPMRNNSIDRTVSVVGQEDTRPASRRRRDVIGRAFSNVSTTSNGSAESSSVVGGFGRSALVHEDNSQGSDDAAAVPTATQIEYDDPEAKLSKARLMSKMLGRNSLGDGSLGPANEDRISMAKVKSVGDTFMKSTGGRSSVRKGHKITTQTRIQLKLQPDSGSIFYQDSEDGVVFHIEATSDTSPSPSSSSSNGDSILDVRTSNNTGRGDQNCETSGEESSSAQTDLIKSFLRQHLVKNGEDSRCLVPMMHKDSIEAMLIAMVGLHLRKDVGQGGGSGAGSAVKTLHKTFGTLFSVLQQREKVLRFVEENVTILATTANKPCCLA